MPAYFILNRRKICSDFITIKNISIQTEQL